MVEIEVDGRTIEVKQGTMLIEAADKAGVKIPRFCYHKNLTVAANCRMCLVEVEKIGKPLPACATPITPGMKVFTQSAMAREAQKSIMEFLLINHPLDCPICDQGGECELQDMAMGYGRDISRFSEKKRVVADEDIGSLIATDMTRCIHCTRCVRFGEEVAGVRELGATGRGEHMRIGTFVEHSMSSEVSGNIIDLCPVGALTSKPYRYQARAWELEQFPAIGPHDCVGSNIFIHTRRGDVMRAVSRDSVDFNEPWISDRDRFSYEGLNAPSRTLLPRIRCNNGQWEEVSWAEALNFVARGLKKILGEHGPKQVAGLASPNSTLEEAYLMQKWLSALGCNNLDHRIRQQDFSAQGAEGLHPNLGLPLREVVKLDSILLVGSNIQQEQPIAGLRVRKAAVRGGKVYAINPVDHAFNFPLEGKLICAPDAMVAHVAGIACALMDLSSVTIDEQAQQLLAGASVEAKHKEIAQTLYAGSRTGIMLGAVALNHPQAGTLRILARLIAQLSSGSYAYLTEGANGSGAWMAGMIPHRGPAGKALAEPGLNAYDAFQQQLKAYVLLGISPQLDCAHPQQAMQALNNADFVVALSAYDDEHVNDYADVVLPIGLFVETAGTYVTIDKLQQSFPAAILPPGKARPAWKVFRVLGNLFELEGFNFNTAQEVQQELQRQLETVDEMSPVNFYPESLRAAPAGMLTRVTEWPMLRCDALVRHADALQQAITNKKPEVRINRKQAEQLGLRDGDTCTVKQGEGVASLPVTLDDNVALGCAWIPAGFQATADLADSFGTVEITK